MSTRNEAAMRYRGNWWLCVALLTALPGATCQSEEDLDGALALARSRQYERAEQVASKLARSPELRSSADLIRSEILLAQSDAESQLEPALKLLDDSTDILRACLRSNPQRNHVAMAKRGIDWRLHRKALRAAEALRALKPSEPTRKREELLQRAVALFEAAALRFRDRLREIETRSAPGGLEERDSPMIAMELCRTLFEHGQLPNLPPDAKKSVIGDVIAGLQDLELDYADDAISFEALWLEGRCHSELGIVSLARDRFEGATTILRRVRAAKKEPNEYHLGVAQNAYVDLCRSHLEDHKPADVIHLVERVFREEPLLERGLPGLALRLQKADALFQEGDIEGAYSLASQVMSADPGGKIGTVAREKVRAWASEGTSQGGKISPERLLVLATALLESEDFAQALQCLQSTVELAQTGADGEKLLPEAFLKTGQCLQHLGKYKEAASYLERVVKEHGDDPLAPQACFEAVRALSSEYSATGRKEDDEAKEALLSTLLTKWPNHPAARNVVCIKAEKLEREKRYSEALDLYAQVPEDAEAIESALLAAARCHYLQGYVLWDAREKQPKSADEARAEFAQGIAVLKKLFDRFADPAFAPERANAVRQRSSLTFLAVGQRAILQSHEAVGENEHALEALSTYVQALGNGDPRLARMLALQVRPYLALGRGDEAVKTAERLLESFPENAAALPAFKLVANYLTQNAADLKSKDGDPEKIRASLSRAHKLYMQWARCGDKRGLKLAASEVLAVADLVSANARVLNGLSESANFILAPGARLEAPQYFSDALYLFRWALGSKQSPLDARDRLHASISAARLEGFLASDGAAWQRARGSYQAIVLESKILTADKKLDPRAFSTPQQAILLAAYLELGVVYQQESKLGQGAYFDLATEVFQNVQSVTQGESESWWLSKFLTLRAYVERGTPADLKVARIVFENTEKNYPDYDGGSFGIKAKMLELKGKLSTSSL